MIYSVRLSDSLLSAMLCHPQALSCCIMLPTHLLSSPLKLPTQLKKEVTIDPEMAGASYFILDDFHTACQGSQQARTEKKIVAQSDTLVST